ncbi:MAG: RagB/SusD family nutrient uptake outer membrane protein, partial [Ferruginibacter sp.]|nr:RagB/SusD family nutrient uptake outer membrane protein [Ferruginibacter sp.]
MRQHINKVLLGCLFVIFVFGVGCKKYLDAKPDKTLVVPSTLDDLQAMLDFGPAVVADPGCDEVSADNYWLTTADYLSLPGEGDRRMYTWQKDNIFQSYPNDWSALYNRIYYCNTVLAGVAAIERTTTNQVNYGNVKGQALLLRGKSFLQGAIIWANAYDEITAGTTLGIPLRLKPDFNEVTVRATLKQNFDQLLNDLMASAVLLPVKPVHVRRPSKPAAYAYLSRAFLYMRKYAEAGKYADSCLQLQNTLLDYNQLNQAASYPVAKFNAEEILYSAMAPLQLVNGVAIVDSTLYDSFDKDDLRKFIFFKSNGNGTYQFKGSYDGSFGGQFTGVAGDEVLLTRAECYARGGNTQLAMDDLNTLLIKRWKTGLFVRFTATNAADALVLILKERRKELIFRGTRCMDIKRLNQEGAAITLKRMVNGETFLLPPNDLRYALPVPEAII